MKSKEYYSFFFLSNIVVCGNIYIYFFNKKICLKIFKAKNLK